MNKQSKRNPFAAVSAILVGLLNLAVVVLLLITPQSDNSILDHANHPGAFIATHYLLGAAALAAIAVLPALTGLARRGSPQWLRWSSTLALIGFALTAVNNFRQAGLDARLAQAYLQAAPQVQESMLISWAGLVELSPQGWLDYAGVGLWLAVVNLLALRAGRISRGLGIMGLVGAASYGLLVTGVVLDVPLLARVGMIVGGVLLLPAWYIALGVRFWRGTVCHRRAAQ